MHSGSPISSLALEQLVDSELLIVAPDTPVLEVIDQISQVRGSGCQLSHRASLSRNSSQPPTVNQKTRASCALVMKQGRLIGIFTEQDLVKLAAASSHLDTAKVGDVSCAVVALSSSAAPNLFAILATFRQHNIRHLPMLDRNGRVVGVVTAQGICSALPPLNFLKLKRVADVMATDVVPASRTTSVLQIAQRMTEQQVSCVAIAEAGSGNAQSPTPVGMITERDIIQLQTLGLNLARTPAQAVMSPPLPIKPQDSLWSAHHQMLSRHAQHLVVIGAGGELVGMITQSGILKVLDPVELLGTLEQLQQVVNSQSRELQQTSQQLREETARREELETALQKTHAALEQQVGLTQAQLVRANASLSSSEAHYRQLFESNPHPMWVYDLETLAFLAVNDAAIAHYGYSRAEFLTMTLRDICPSQDVPALEENIAQVTAGLDHAGTWQHLKKDGTAITVEITTHTLIWRGKRAEVVLANDVTKLVRSQAALGQKTQMLETYSSSLKKLHRISTTNYQNFDGLFADYLGAGCEILGMSTGIVSSITQQTYTIRAVRSPFDFLVTGLEFALGDTYCAAVVARNQTFAYTHVGEIPAMQSHPVYQNLRLESYIGTPIYVEGEIYGTLNFSSLEARPNFDPYEQEIVELMAQGLGRLIAADRLEKKRQQAEQETQHALRLARNSENRLRTIIDSEPECIKLVDLSGQVLDMNPAGLSILEIDRLEQVKGRSVSSLIAPEYRQAFQELNQKVCQGNKGTLEFEIVSQRGNRRWMETHAAPLWDEERGEFIQLAITRDITERRQAQEKLERSYRQAQLLAEITRRIRQSLHLEEILQTTVSEVQNLLACDRVLIYQIFPDGTGKTISERVLPEYPATLGTPFSKEVFPSSSQERYCRGRLRAIADVQAPAADLPECLQEFFVQLAVKAVLVVPILHPNPSQSATPFALGDRSSGESVVSKLWGLLVVHQCSRPRQWEPLEIDLLRQLGDQIGVALSQAQILDRLEERVSERTNELTNINQQLQQEIKERQVAQSSLQENQQKLAGILETADEAIISVDQKRRILLFNQGAERIFGYTAAEVLSKPLDILLPEGSCLIQQQHNRRFGSSKSNSPQMAERSANVFGRRQNGEEFPAEASVSKLERQAGPIFTVMLKDVTERQRSEAALRRSEAQLRLITDALPVLIAYVDAEQRYRFNNQTYEEWFGRSRLQIKGRTVREVVGEEAYQQVQAYIKTALAGQPVMFETKILIKKDYRWIGGTYVPDFGEDGDVRGFFALISDISELKAVQQMKSEFISVVSHELRTPLTSIHGSLKLLSTGQLGSLTQPGQEMLNIALKNTDRLTRLVSDILDLERIESGRANLNWQTCNVATLLEQAVEAMVGMARAEEITLAINPISAQVWADPDGVVQVLTNLISNAIKFSPPGTTVRLAAINQGQEVLFQVKDQGRGIPVDKRESIFERFQQVDSSDSRAKGGTGLGLAICREIVRRHGGRIWAESRLGEGSTFYFTLRVAMSEQRKG